MFWIWIIILLIGLLIVLLPPWPYMQERDLGYGPSAIAFTPSRPRATALKPR